MKAGPKIVARTLLVSVRRECIVHDNTYISLLLRSANLAARVQVRLGVSILGDSTIDRRTGLSGPSSLRGCKSVHRYGCDLIEWN